MGFTREELEAVRDRGVPDLVGDDVRLLFVGINPGLWTAASGAHFAHPTNRFYRALHEAGIIDAPLDVADGYDKESRRALVARGVGITNLVNRATARASELEDRELVDGACALETKIAAWRPGIAAFVGITAYRTAYGRPVARVGPQDDHTIAGIPVWALPNPSGLNAHYRIEDLARLYRDVALAAGLEITGRGENRAS